MELTVSIKEQSKIAAFLNMLKEFDYVEIINVKEENNDLPQEHKELLAERLKNINQGETTFSSWESIKNKYSSSDL